MNPKSASIFVRTTKNGWLKWPSSSRRKVGKMLPHPILPSRFLWYFPRIGWYREDKILNLSSSECWGVLDRNTSNRQISKIVLRDVDGMEWLSSTGKRKAPDVEYVDQRSRKKSMMDHIGDSETSGHGHQSLGIPACYPDPTPCTSPPHTKSPTQDVAVIHLVCAYVSPLYI
jgi:hypothetical protein